MTCCCVAPKTSNVKFHFKTIFKFCKSDLSSIANSKHIHSIKVCRNFIVLRVHPSSIVFTLFYASTHVNVSGVKDFCLIPLALQLFNTIFNCDITCSDIVVDNSTSSGLLECYTRQTHARHRRRLNPLIVKTFLETNSHGSDCYVSLHPHFFPGAVLRNITKQSSGTVILFATAKYIIVGAKSRADVLHIKEALCAIIRESWKTSIQET